MQCYRAVVVWGVDARGEIVVIENDGAAFLGVAILKTASDAQPETCRRQIAHDSLKWSTVCDGRMWETPLLQKFGLADVPANLLIDSKGKVVARNLTVKHLEERIHKMMH